MAVNLKNKITAVCIAALLATCTIVPTAAYAAEVDSNSGKGYTDLLVKIQDKTERGGTIYNDQTKDFYNPEKGTTGFGKNIAFTAPLAVNFYIDSLGELTAPSASAVYIENQGASRIHASSLEVYPEDTWHVVENANADSLTGDSPATQNNVSIQITPNGDTGTGKISLHNYLTTGAGHTALPATASWNMQAGINSTSVLTDRVQLGITGNFSRIFLDLDNNTGTKFCRLHWFMTNGLNAS